VAIPVAMGIFVPWGIDISMAAGAIAMSLSTIIVAANAQLLRRVRLHRDAPPPPPAQPRLATA
jgi:Cu2+-exporting ATPase